MGAQDEQASVAVARARKRETSLELTGETEEHDRLRTLLGTVGAPGLLKRLIEPGGEESVHKELQLDKLCLEARGRE